MVRVSKCHRRIMKIKIINDSEMSRLSVPIHVFVLSNFKLLKIARNADFHNEYHWAICPFNILIPGIFM